MMDRIKEEGSNVSKEVKKQTAGYITAALGLVAGLAWSDAIKSLIDFLYPAQGNSVTAKFVYAVIITLAVVFLSVYLIKRFGNDSKE